MLNKKIEKAINDQINAEFYSAFLYLSMSAYFERMGLSGFANWMYIQYQEENTHALKFFKYINERGGTINLDKIEKPTGTWDSPVAVIENALSHEQYVTSLINKIVDLAIEEKDYATQNFLNWYVNEQVEEEANAEAILAKLNLANNSKEGLLFLDKELSTRVFVDETIAE